MTDLRKAEKRVLELLEIVQGDLRDATEILRQALAQPEQEPVAWMHNFIEGNVITHKPVDIGRNPERWTPLYTAPPKREWVDLTDDEINHTPFRFTMINGPGDALLPFARAVMAKLKEKNSA